MYVRFDMFSKIFDMILAHEKINKSSYHYPQI